jgi:DNA (cytosine-5)-methyltransferase 1
MVKIIELFAGVGGFRVALENSNLKHKIVWSNQYEPSTKKQHASEIYCKHFTNQNHSNKDITRVNEKDIPKHDLLVGGFPCQDYSVACSLNNSYGLKGKKGVLWWEIYRIIKEHQTPYLVLENVDRIIISPAKQRGKDFSIILKSLMMLDYIVEWRIINSAEYGYPQKRKRTYFLIYKKNSKLGNKIKNIDINNMYLNTEFKIKFNEKDIVKTELNDNIETISNCFNKNNKDRKYFNTGIAYNNNVYSVKAEVNYNGPYKCINDILINEELVEQEFYIKDEDIDKWKDFKFAKSISKINKKTGISYVYKQGNMEFPENVLKPSRTIITSEGNKTPSRTTHVIKVNNKLRRLHPIELERLNGFPDNFTFGATNSKRGFLMGNALIVDIIKRIVELIPLS